MFSSIAKASLALSLVNGLIVPQNDAVLSKRAPAPFMLNFSVVRDTSENSTLYDPQRYFGRYHDGKEKRALPVSISDIGDVSYEVDVYLGTLREGVTVQLDTGSSDLWVYGPDVLLAPGGTFYPYTSKHDKKTDDPFQITYVDGSGAKGDYYTDDFSFLLESNLLLDFRFAVVSSSSSFTKGVLGIADRNLESTQHRYDNLPWALQKAGVIPKASYSLFIGDNQGDAGSIIFGGIDTEKYEGDLIKYPIAGESGFFLNVESASINGETITLNQNYILDSGTSWNLWPAELLSAVAKVLGSSGDDNGFYYVDCTQPSDKFIEFNFGQNKIKLAYSDLVVNAGLFSCAVGAQATSSGPYILGDVFLRKAYVYYDLTDQTISLAQAKYSSSSNIIAA